MMSTSLAWSIQAPARGASDLRPHLRRAVPHSTVNVVANSLPPSLPIFAVDRSPHGLHHGVGRGAAVAEPADQRKRWSLARQDPPASRAVAVLAAKAVTEDIEARLEYVIPESLRLG
jgi:hypothetical protein